MIITMEKGFSNLQFTSSWNDAIDISYDIQKSWSLIKGYAVSFIKNGWILS